MNSTEDDTINAGTEADKKFYQQKEYLARLSEFLTTTSSTNRRYENIIKGHIS